MTKKQKCFVIMPISMPDMHLPRYDKNKDHFRDILSGLITPAVELAGYEVVPPEPEGSDLIHGRIIKNLMECEMVLCDISMLNANVFFEMGIRTALNKPVALIKDEHDINPFDTGGIKHHEYSYAPSWIGNKKQIQCLSDHIKKTEDLGDSNPLWDYFGFSAQQAGTLSDDHTTHQKLAYLIQQVSEIKTRPPATVSPLSSYDCDRLHIDFAPGGRSGTDIRELLGPDAHILGTITMPDDDSMQIPLFIDSDAGFARVIQLLNQEMPDKVSGWQIYGPDGKLRVSNSLE